MAKRKTILYLTAETAVALGEYQRRHRDRFGSPSAAAEHLLRRALLGEFDEGLEGLLAPLVERRVEEAAARAVEARVAPLLKGQTDRLAGLLVRSGKDARTAHQIGVALLEVLTGDRARARQLAEDARLRAASAYAAGALRGTPGDE